MPTPEVLEISWTATPPGLVGQRPRALAANTKVTVHTNDPGTVRIEFTDRTPLANNQMFIKAGETAELVTPGKYKFRCHLQRDGAPDLVLDPDDPKLPDGGGELEILPGGKAQ